MKLDRLLAALESERPAGRRIDQWRLYATDGRRISLGVKDRDSGGPHAPLAMVQSGGVRYLLVWDDGKLSRGYFERSMLEHDPGRGLSEARAAAYEDPDAAQVLGPAPFPDVELRDAETARAATGELGSLASRLDTVRQLVERAGVRTWSGSFSYGEGHYRLLTSAGIDTSGSGTSTGWHVTVNGEVGDGLSGRQSEPEEAFRARLERLFSLASELERPAESMPAGRNRVLLHPRVVESYVLDTLLANLDGAAISNEESHFRREQFDADRPVLREDVTLRVDPLQPLKSGSYRVTREGVPAVACSYIEAGRLRSPIADLKYAKRLGIRPTAVPYAMDALEFRGLSELELGQALDAADGGALVLSVLGVHTQDAASGDFSLSAPQALAVLGGRLSGKLRATISGNLFEILCDPATAFVRFEGEHTPGLSVVCRLDPR